jgi:hypothetical protein
MTARTRRFAKALVAAFPKFGRTLQEAPNGDFEAWIRAPRGSKARVLVCQTQGRDVWLRLGPPRTFYSIDSTRELVEIVGAILRDDVHVAVLSNQRRWSATTLVSRGARPAQEIGESARIISWSGKCDRRLRSALRATPYQPAVAKNRGTR